MRMDVKEEMVVKNRQLEEDPMVMVKKTRREL